MQLIYEVTDEEAMKQDMEILKEGFRLLEYDYLGGSGSRGYGRVKISEIQLDTVIGDVSNKTIEYCQTLLNE